MDFNQAQGQDGLEEVPEVDRTFEYAILVFRSGCRAEYAEQSDGTYKVTINGEMYPRHLRAINEIFRLFAECSKEDRIPEPPQIKGKRLFKPG